MNNVLKLIKNKVITNKKEALYNIFVIVCVWLLYVCINYVLWEKIINFLFDKNLFYIYILVSPILVAWLISKLLIKDQSNKKYIIFGITVPLILYYLTFASFIFLALQAFNNSSFPF
jgi:hypothetical protein